jgi:hypothetical protein
MRQTRRDLLGTTGAAFAAGGLASCNAAETGTMMETGTTTETGGSDDSNGSPGDASTGTAAADESAATVVVEE